MIMHMGSIRVRYHDRSFLHPPPLRSFSQLSLLVNKACAWYHKFGVFSFSKTLARKNTEHYYK